MKHKRRGTFLSCNFKLLIPIWVRFKDSLVRFFQHFANYFLLFAIGQQLELRAFACLQQVNNVIFKLIGFKKIDFMREGAFYQIRTSGNKKSQQPLE